MTSASLLAAGVLLFLCGCPEGGPRPTGTESDGGIDAAPAAACPMTAPSGRSSCAGVPDGTRCSYPLPDSSVNECGCSAGMWFCSSCGFVGGLPPTGVYRCDATLQNGCRMDTWEWEITCHCLKPESVGFCCGSESLNRYYNCQPERLYDGGPCCASCPSTPVDGGSRQCSCGADHRFRCL